MTQKLGLGFCKSLFLLPWRLSSKFSINGAENRIAVALSNTTGLTVSLKKNLKMFG